MNHSRRTAKVAEAIREVVATSVLFGLRDPRVAGVTVLGVEVAGDLKTAKVFVSVMGEEKRQKLCMHGLDSSRGFLQRKIADQLDLRYTPVLTFVLDDGIKKSLAASQILREIADARRAEAIARGELVEEDEEDELDSEEYQEDESDVGEFAGAADAMADPVAESTVPPDVATAAVLRSDTVDQPDDLPEGSS